MPLYQPLSYALASQKPQVIMKSYQMRLFTNTCQEISKYLKCILEKGGDNKEKLHGLNGYCSYLSHTVRTADVAHFRQLHKRGSKQGSCVSFPTALQREGPSLEADHCA